MDLGLVDPADVKGDFNVKDIDNINNATTVKWSALDLMFYPDSSATALSAFVCHHYVNFAQQFTDASYSSLVSPLY